MPMPEVTMVFWLLAFVQIHATFSIVFSFTGKPLSFIPWLTIKALALVVFTSMVIFEVSVGSGVSR